MKWLIEKFNVHNDETIQLISSEIDKHKKSLAELHKLIKDYQMTMSNHNDAERFKVYKLMAAAVQDLQYSLKFSLKTALKEYENPRQNKYFQAPSKQLGLHLFHGDILREIAGYLSPKEIMSLARTQSIFYGKGKKSDFNFNLLAKKRKLLELKNSQYFGLGPVFDGEESHFLLINNKVYAFGANTAGQLGAGDCKDKNQPTEISFAHLNLAPDDKIRQVSVGGNHTYVLQNKAAVLLVGRMIVAS